jgi:hypothetical protein
MHDFITTVTLYFVSVFVSVFLAYFIRHKYVINKALKEVAELKDCPFDFTVRVEDIHSYIIFNFDKGTTLWCAYNIGIRCDGICGVNNLKVMGINTNYCRSIELQIGQSVFPLIDKMEEFESWAKSKTFDYGWDTDFHNAWEGMKNRLDNLRYLETKSKQKEKDKKTK